MGNGGMQPTYGPRTDNTHLTTGGNHTLTNGCECDAIAASYETTAVAVSPLGEDDSHVQGVYREQNFAGS